jgi:hypothetical protein
LHAQAKTISTAMLHDVLIIHNDSQSLKVCSTWGSVSGVNLPSKMAWARPIFDENGIK